MLVSPINALDNGLALTPPSKLLELAIALLFHEILTVENPEIPVGKLFGVQSDAFLLLLLGFTADVHTFCMLSIFC